MVDRLADQSRDLFGRQQVAGLADFGSRSVTGRRRAWQRIQIHAVIVGGLDHRLFYFVAYVVHAAHHRDSRQRKKHQHDDQDFHA